MPECSLPRSPEDIVKKLMCRTYCIVFRLVSVPVEAPATVIVKKKFKNSVLLICTFDNATSNQHEVQPNECWCLSIHHSTHIPPKVYSRWWNAPANKRLQTEG